MNYWFIQYNPKKYNTVGAGLELAKIKRYNHKKIKYMEVDVYRDGEYGYTEVFSKKDLKKVYSKNGFFIVESIRGTFLFSPISAGLIEFYYEGQEIESLEDKKRR